MSLKRKLVIRACEITGDDNVTLVDGFKIVKSVNTLDFGVPGDSLTRDEVDRILKVYNQQIRTGEITVEFIN